MIGNAPNFAGSQGQFLATDLITDLYFRGKAFSFEEYFTFSSEEVKLFVFDPATYAGELIDFFPILMAATSGPVLVDLYSNFIGAADGTLLGASNRRAGFPGPAGTLRLNPTPTSPGEYGTRFAGDIIVATGLNPSTSNGAQGTPSLRFEPSRTLKTAFTLTNTDGAGTKVLVKLTWFEH